MLARGFKTCCRGNDTDKVSLIPSWARFCN